MKILPNEFTFITLKNEHVSEILALQERIIASLPTPELLRRNTEQMFLECVSSPNLTLGAFYGGRLVGIGILYVPTDENEDLAHLLIDVNGEGALAANYKLCMVEEAYRGNGLQRKFGTLLEGFAKQNGIQLLCATVSPCNSYSHNNMLALGYTRNRTLQKYGMTRDLFYKFI